MKFVDVKTDIAFRKIFGNENKKEILISFLNSVLDLKDEHEIDDIEILNPFQAPKLKELKETNDVAFLGTLILSSKVIASIFIIFIFFYHASNFISFFI